MSMEEISYSTGKLGRKIGVSRTTIVKHLRQSGLIDECYKTPRGHIRIPYSVAIKIASPEALSIPVPVPPGNAIVRVPRRQAQKPLSTEQQRKETPPAPQPNYVQLGKQMRAAGFSLADLVKYIEQQIGITPNVDIPDDGDSVNSEISESEETN